MIRYKIAAVWIALQTLFFAAWAYREESRLGEGQGQSILVRVVPYDPRDYLRGQYAHIAFDFSRGSGALALDPAAKPGETVWVVLRKDGKFHEPARAERQRPTELGPDEVAIRGTAAGYSRYEFGIEMYFIPEGTPEVPLVDASAKLRVGDDGAPRIEQLYIKDSPWP